jgi:hypothetical protein
MAANPSANFITVTTMKPASNSPPHGLTTTQIRTQSIQIHRAINQAPSHLQHASAPNHHTATCKATKFPNKPPSPFLPRANTAKNYPSPKPQYPITHHQSNLQTKP